MRFCDVLRVIVVLPMVALGASLSADDGRPNIIVFFADDLGYGELGCQGNPEIPTPYIDSIAESGVRFTAGYVAGPNCSPSRAGLLTGRTPTRFGYEFNPIGARNEEPGIGLPSQRSDDRRDPARCWLHHGVDWKMASGWRC